MPACRERQHRSQRCGDQPGLWRGGNPGSKWTNDYIERYNRGASPVNLTGWSVQYASAAGSTWQKTDLGALTLAPGQDYLVQEVIGAGGVEVPNHNGRVDAGESNPALASSFPGQTMRKAPAMDPDIAGLFALGLWFAARRRMRAAHRRLAAGKHR